MGSVIRMVESGLARPANADSLLDDLARGLSAPRFEALAVLSTYPKGAILYAEGQAPRGVFIIARGRAKLTTSSADGKAALLRVAEAGDIVGLPATISGQPYEVTAEASEDLQVKFIRRADFLQVLAQNGEACLKVAGMLALIYHSAYREVRYLALSHSAAQKLAGFLLDQFPHAPGADNHIRIL
jgi:CRP/FNR family transcriptional regulator